MASPIELNYADESTAAADRQSRPRSAMVNASWNAFATFWNIAISFVLTPLLISSLGTAHFGLLLLIWSVTGVMGIATFGLGEATLRYVAHYYAAGDMAGVNRVFRSTLTFYVVVCGVAAAILCGGAHWFVSWMSIPAEQQSLVTWLLRLSSVTFFLNVISGGALSAIPMALHRYDISGKISMIQGVVRSGGFLVLALSGFGILQLIVWDLVIQLGMLFVLATIARRLIPSLRLLPSPTFRGLREIFGYSVYTFLTHFFLSMYRESGKLLLGAKIGPSSVAYYGTPDSVAYRLYMVLISGGETLLPRFSSTRDAKEARDLLLNATWGSLALSVVVLVPLAVVMPDLLRLWINPEFASHSAAVGQLVALCFIAPAAFAPIATYFRGAGKPGFVTAVMAGAGITTLVACALLIPRYGVLGVGYAYLLSCIPWLVGLVCGWLRAFGRPSLAWLARSVLVPIVLGGLVYTIAVPAWNRVGEVNWLGVVALGSLLTSITALLVFGTDWVLGGDPPSRRLLQRIAESGKVGGMLRRLRRIRGTISPIVG